MTDNPALAALDAADQGDMETLRDILARHGSEAVRADQDPDQLTALHLAASAGHADVVSFLTSEAVGADSRALRHNNFSPLHAAAMQGHVGICKILLELGADPDVQTNPQGYAPLHSAAWAGHIDTVTLLLEFSARTDVKNYRGETPAQTARRQGWDEVAATLES